MKSIFSLKWFKDFKENLKKEVKDELKKETLTEQTTIPPGAQVKHYAHVRLVNNVLSVVLNSGDVVSKPEATVDDFYKVRNASSEKEILDIVSLPEAVQEKIEYEKELEKTQNILKGIEILRNFPDFKVEDNSVYLVESNRTIPELLVMEFLEVIGKYGDKPIKEIQEALKKDNQYQGLRNFFLWACLNPRAEVADKLYGFLKKNSFRITKQGFFAALRNVVTIKTDNNKEIVHFVSNAYNKVKAVWKKNPDNFRVVLLEDGQYTLEKVTNTNPAGAIVGNLTTLYKDLPEMSENRFTDDWTKTFDIRVGRVVSMPMEQCNWSTQDCAAAGLHFTSDEINYVGCGDTSMLVLINPMKVVGIGEKKGRCYEYLPIMTVPREESTNLLHDLDFDTLELDEEYAIHELENLSEKAKNGFSAEVKKYQFNVPSITNNEMSKIVNSLDKMKDILSKRIVSVSK